MKKLLTPMLVLAVCSSAQASYHAHRPSHHCYYVGANTGASVVTNQSFDHYHTNTPYWFDHRDESSARGFNGGFVLGYNFYHHCKMLLGAELGYNLYSNRGHYTINSYNPNNGTHSNFEYSHDMEYSLHLTLRPAFMIDPCTLFYLNVGLAYAKVNFKTENKTPAIAPPYPLNFSSDDTRYGLTLGTGLQKNITDKVSLFAEYQYTRYRHFSPDPVRYGGTLVQPAGNIHQRSANIDTNVFKLGFLYTF